MAKRLKIPFDSEEIESISTSFDLRTPNFKALRQLVYTLNEGYDPAVMQVLNLATGVGKTYLMAAFIEYLRRQGIYNVVIVTPGRIIQAKTVDNFSPGSHQYIEGADVPPDIVTPQDNSEWVRRVNDEAKMSFGGGLPSLVFIFNIQQLIAPKNVEGDTHGSTQDAERRKPRRFDENAGVLFDYLKELDDLVVIADESHLYSSSAAAFHAALEELDPAVIVGLTASVLPGDHVIYQYPLYKAIRDQFVKTPVLAFRKGGYGENQAAEEQQLRDALKLREIKQSYYDSYADRNKKDRINAAVFVVCADVEHATQTAALLRSPEYFNRDLAVLQVDSQHEDETTEKLLKNMDQPGSPVLAVVSVNKLKEGWDVKNIAIVVTLRAMTSEVLTQQTMGRGLRLPFGKHTGDWQIDQLDIIAHQSFRELLEAENVLAQFGLDDAVSPDGHDNVTAAIQKAADNINGQSVSIEDTAATGHGDMERLDKSSEQISTNSIENSAVWQDTSANQSGETAQCDATPSVGVRIWDDDNSENCHYESGNNELFPTVIPRNPQFSDVSYQFPVTIMKPVQPPINLSEITEESIEKAAKRVTSTGEVLYRKMIIAALGKKLQTVDAESAEVDSAPVAEEDAKEALIRFVMDMQLVPSTESVAKYVEGYLVPKFMRCVDFSDWTVKSLSSAGAQLRAIVQDYIVGVQRATKEERIIFPGEIVLDAYSRGIGEEIYDPIDSKKQFVPNRIYSGWRKSLYECEYFDSYSGEYELARLLNISPHITWWHRLHPHNGAFIYYTPKDRYFPDFVALDTDGVHWIIEGKNKAGRDKQKVKDKRAAAESTIRQLTAESAFAGQLWGYLIAFEDDIASADSWDDLKTLAQPVSNVI